MKKNIGLLLVALSLGSSTMVAMVADDEIPNNIAAAVDGIGNIAAARIMAGSASERFQAGLDQLEARLNDRFKIIEARIRNLEKKAEDRSDLFRYKSKNEMRKTYSEKRDAENADRPTVNDERTQKNLNWREKIRLHKRVQKAGSSGAAVQLDESND